MPKFGLIAFQFFLPRAIKHGWLKLEKQQIEVNLSCAIHHSRLVKWLVVVHIVSDYHNWQPATVDNQPATKAVVL